MGVIENRIDITELERSGGGGGGGTAASVSYDNTSSGLTATTVQGAIDEVVAESAGKDQISNRNLLDNPFFTVNQRGETSYAGSNKYTFDRWKLISAGGSESAASVSISDGVVTLDPDEDEYVLIAQAFEDYLYNSIAGKVLTMSVLLSDDSIVTGTATFTDKDTSVEFGTGTGYAFGFYTGQGFRVVATSDLAIKAVKLEIGSVSTLEMDVAPNYADELSKCKRYFQRIRGDLFRTNTYSANYMFFLFSLEVEMRSNDITVTGTPIVKNMAATPQTGFTFTYTMTDYNQSISIAANKVDHGLTDGYINCGNDGLTISADL